MTPYQLKKTLQAMRSDMNALTVSAIGANKAISDLLNAIDDCGIADDIESLYEALAVSLGFLATALEKFQKDSAPFIGGD